jgi:hypothetical protein
MDEYESIIVYIVISNIFSFMSGWLLCNEFGISTRCLNALLHKINCIKNPPVPQPIGPYKNTYESDTETEEEID